MTCQYMCNWKFITWERNDVCILMLCGQCTHRYNHMKEPFKGYYDPHKSKQLGMNKESVWVTSETLQPQRSQQTIVDVSVPTISYSTNRTRGM